jgi:hypothetical protein
LQVVPEQLLYKKMSYDLCVRRGIEYVSCLLQLLSKHAGIYQISVMGYCNGPIFVFDQQRLAILDA